MNAVQLEHKLKDMLEVPISISKQRVFEYLQLYYSASWQNLFTELNMPRALSLWKSVQAMSFTFPRL